jgi:hypothetical protein
MIGPIIGAARDGFMGPNSNTPNIATTSISALAAVLRIRFFSIRYSADISIIQAQPIEAKNVVITANLDHGNADER